MDIVPKSNPCLIDVVVMSISFGHPYYIESTRMFFFTFVTFDGIYYRY